MLLSSFGVILVLQHIRLTSILSSDNMSYPNATQKFRLTDLQRGEQDICLYLFRKAMNFSDIP